MGLLQRHSSKFLQNAFTLSKEFSSHSMAVKHSGSNSSISATTAILSMSRTAPTTWYLPVRTNARAVFRPSPDDVPVTMASFLSPNLARASIASCAPLMDGSLKLLSCLNAPAAVASASTILRPRAMMRDLRWLR